MDSRPSDRTEISERFRRFRREALFTQRRLGRIIAVSRQTVSKIENCRVTPHPATWERFYALERKHQQPAIVFPKHWA